MTNKKTIRNKYLSVLRAVSICSIFAIAFIAPIAFAVEGFDPYAGGLNAENAAGLVGVSQSTNLSQLIGSIMNFFLGFVGLVATLYALYGGFLILTAGGNSDQVSTGRKSLTYAVIGIVIIFISWTLVGTLISGLQDADPGASQVNPGTTTNFVQTNTAPNNAVIVPGNAKPGVDSVQGAVPASVAQAQASNSQARIIQDTNNPAILVGEGQNAELVPAGSAAEPAIGLPLKTTEIGSRDAVPLFSVSPRAGIAESTTITLNASMSRFANTIKNPRWAIKHPESQEFSYLSQEFERLRISFTMEDIQSSLGKPVVSGVYLACFSYDRANCNGTNNLEKVAVGQISVKGVPPVANMQVQKPASTNPLLYDFDFSASVDPSKKGIDMISMDFGDGVKEELSTPKFSHMYAQSGRYKVTASVRNRDGQWSAPVSRFVIVNSDLWIDTSGSIFETMLGRSATVNIEAVASPKATVFEINIPTVGQVYRDAQAGTDEEGNAVSLLAPVEISLEAAGKYPVVITAYDNASKSISGQKLVFIKSNEQVVSSIDVQGATHIKDSKASSGLEAVCNQAGETSAVYNTVSNNYVTFSAADSVGADGNLNLSYNWKATQYRNAIAQKPEVLGTGISIKKKFQALPQNEGNYYIISLEVIDTQNNNQRCMTNIRLNVANNPPIANLITKQRTAGVSPYTITIDASGSFDADNDPLEYTYYLVDASFDDISSIDCNLKNENLNLSQDIGHKIVTTYAPQYSFILENKKADNAPHNYKVFASVSDGLSCHQVVEPILYSVDQNELTPQVRILSPVARSATITDFIPLRASARTALGQEAQDQDIQWSYTKVDNGTSTTLPQRGAELNWDTSALQEASIYEVTVKASITAGSGAGKTYEKEAKHTMTIYEEPRARINTKPPHVRKVINLPGQHGYDVRFFADTVNGGYFYNKERVGLQIEIDPDINYDSDNDGSKVNDNIWSSDTSQFPTESQNPYATHDYSYLRPGETATAKMIVVDERGRRASSTIQIKMQEQVPQPSQNNSLIPQI